MGTPTDRNLSDGVCGATAPSAPDPPAPNLPEKSVHELPHRKLARRDNPSDDERGALVEIMAPARKVAARQDIVSEHDRPNHSALLISGFAGRYVTLPDGRRQITEISVPGDFVDLTACSSSRCIMACWLLQTLAWPA